ncbi:MAG: DUF3429 domain-containing protein [Pseudomonadota bacterium]
MQNLRLIKFLTYAGALPFLACALLPYVGIERLGAVGRGEEILVADILLSYGLAISSFLAGTLWASELHSPGRTRLPLLLLSNALLLVTWLTALAAPLGIALVTQIVVFGVLLLADRQVFAAGGLDVDYWRLRRRITAIVLLALLLGLGQAWPE